MDAALVLEQNKIASSGAWIWLLEIAIAGTDTVLRYTNDNAVGGTPSQLYTTWNGHNYWSMPFTMDDVVVSTDGKFPEYRLQIGEVDLDGAIRGWVGTNAGLVGSTVRLMVVHSAHLDLTTPAVDELAEILNCEVTAGAVVFILGIPSLLSRRFPRDKYVPGYCRHKFGGALCRYVQPTHQRKTSNISFIPGVVTGDPDIEYNTIYSSDGGLITDLFSHAPGSMVSPNSLVLNGGFEDGVVGGTKFGWDSTGYPNYWEALKSSSVFWSSTVSKYGNYSCFYHNSSNSDAIKQTINLTPGVTYTFSFWAVIAIQDPKATFKMFVIIGGHRYGIYVHDDVIGWARYTRTLTVPADSDGVTDIVFAGRSSVYVDGVCAVVGSTGGDFTGYGLSKDTGFTVSGSVSNDGFFLANMYHAVNELYVRVFMEDAGVKPFVAESAGAPITIRLGYDQCNHTLGACKLRNNTQNYGGSPGITGGMYG